MLSCCRRGHGAAGVGSVCQGCRGALLPVQPPCPPFHSPPQAFSRCAAWSSWYCLAIVCQEAAAQLTAVPPCAAYSRVFWSLKLPAGQTYPADIAQDTAQDRCCELRAAVKGACAVEDSPLCMMFRSPLHGQNEEDQALTADLTWPCCAEALRSLQAQTDSGNLQSSVLTCPAPAVQECPVAPGASRPCDSELLTADVACP